ncbi:TonB-dependent receptor [Danxiaibacter flavus]|uniref:TonB-dependent receptor n=1 Tax=Danxiaibacter flavus TaxID=3049108 RepID=A0ABV3ZND2_9BACT|nr:TonB-dependent receptor [Chitinophagaceae bacterium DXS]
MSRNHSPHHPVTYQLMKFIFYCCVLLATTHEAIAQKDAEMHVSIHFNDASYRQVFQSIKKQTGYVFFYSNQLLNDKERLTVNFQNAKLKEVLDYLFREKPITYQFNGQKILLSEKKAEPTKSAEASITPPPVQEVMAEIKGQVMDVDGNPLSGVAVMLKSDPGKGVMTDDLGIFVIQGRAGETLSVSMVGMNTQDVLVPHRGVLKVTLTAKQDVMKDVVVTSYGKQTKITVTGAVASVNMTDMQTPVPNLTNALAGKVAGIISVQSSGEPGYDNSTFTIRGIGSFTGNNSPLIIVDGVQRDDVNGSYGGAYNNIDPEDVASISLLKDASSTAMYGAKGANGVLIITTKRGVAGKARISLKAETGATGFAKKPEMLDGISYMQLYNEARKNMGLTETYSQDQIQKTASGLDPYIYPNVSWMDQVYKDYSPLTNINLNVTGGGENVRYFVSGSYYSQKGPYNVRTLNDYNPNLSFKRYDFRTNLDVNITRTTLMQLNLDAMLVDQQFPGISAGNLWYLTFATTPVGFPPQYPDGKWAGPNDGANPLNEVQNNGYAREFHPTVQSVFTVTQKLDALTKGLSAYGRFSFDSYGEFDNRRTGVSDLYLATGRDENGNLIYTQNRIGQEFLGYSQSSTGDRTMYLEANINYDRTFGPHRFGGMVLYNMRNHLISTAGDAISSIPYKNQSIAGRINYGYMDKYLLEVNAGYTGSENFEAGKRFGFFPSVSTGWVVSKEDFFKGMSSTVSLLKLRGSYGIVGNDNIGGTNTRFPYLTQIGDGSHTGFGLNGGYAGGITEKIIGIQDLTWERSYKTDIGIEIGLFKKLNIIADYFVDHRKDILVERKTVSGIAGYNGSQVYANLGEARNRGVDGNIEYNDQFGKVGLRLFGNFTYAVNKIIFQDEPQRKYAYQSGTGHMFGEFTGYNANGLFADQNDINKSPVQQFGTVAPGDVRYKDMNGDNIVDASDWSYLGKSFFPKWQYGTGFTVSYHGFDVSALFQGISDVGIMANGNYISSGYGVPGVGVIPFSGLGRYPNNSLTIIKDRWTEDNPRQNAAYPRLTIASTQDNNYLNSSWWLKDGSYIRLKQVSVGYNFSSAKMKRAGFNSLYVYLSGQNLLTFSKFKLWDPELGSNGAKYPITRMATFGIRALF